MSGIACVHHGKDDTQIVTGRNVNATLKEYQRDPVYHYCINTLADRYGVTPLFLLCAKEHVYSVENELVFGYVG